MLNARLVDMAAIEWNVGLFSICYYERLQCVQTAWRNTFLIYFVLLQFPQLE